MDTNGEYFANLKSKPALVLPRSDKKDRSAFLGFAVEDTGCGLSAKEKARLFMRFSQANHKTHIQYGVRSFQLTSSSLTDQILVGKRTGAVHMQGDCRALRRPHWRHL